MHDRSRSTISTDKPLPLHSVSGVEHRAQPDVGTTYDDDLDISIAASAVSMMLGPTAPTDRSVLQASSLANCVILYQVPDKTGAHQFHQTLTYCRTPIRVASVLALVRRPSCPLACLQAMTDSHGVRGQLDNKHRTEHDVTLGYSQRKGKSEDAFRDSRDSHLLSGETGVGLGEAGHP